MRSCAFDYAVTNVHLSRISNSTEDNLLRPIPSSLSEVTKQAICFLSIAPSRPSRGEQLTSLLHIISDCVFAGIAEHDIYAL